jgi:hypothetical protein
MSLHPLRRRPPPPPPPLALVEWCGGGGRLKLNAGLYPVHAQVVIAQRRQWEMRCDAK